MKSSLKILLAVVLTVVSAIMCSLAIKSYQIKKVVNPKIEIQNAIKKNSDSVAVVSVGQPDTLKLRKLEALKLRIATAQYNDSIQRAAH